MAKFTPNNPLFHDYDAFVEKFKPKKTTDDCYTPPEVYEAVLAWARTLPRFPKDANIVRPFWPGADYQGITYGDNDVVVDNPPFSIISRIVGFYTEHDIPFFLFAPALTLFGATKDREGVTALVASCDVVYENGARVPTSFITNMDDTDVAFRTVPDLSREVEEISRRLEKQAKKTVEPKSYPDNVVSAALLGKIVKRGVEFRVRRSEAVFIRKLDGMGAKGIFGGGFLLSDAAAAERAAAERAAADRAAADRAAAERAAAESFDLSEREKALIASMART